MGRPDQKVARGEPLELFCALNRKLYTDNWWEGVGLDSTYTYFYMDIFTYSLYTDSNAAMFEWDRDKDRSNRLKHGVSFETAKHAFFDPKRIIAEDLEHGQAEARFYCIGRGGGGILTVRFTLREHSIRIFGAGFWRKGKAIYEKENRLH
jgi:uncharacterized DUF497 family protein